LSYNPLDLTNLAEQLRRALEEVGAVRLDRLERFSGAGLYALYYTGPFPLYRPLSAANRRSPTLPIYVGKAVTDAARKGGGVVDDVKAALLYNRIQKHAASIIAARTTLKPEDFHVRALVTQPVWVSLGETALISRYRPLWNVVIDGFGNNDPGGRRRQQYRSMWDHLHPGRAWAAQQADNPAFSLQTLTERVRAHLGVKRPDALDV